MPARTNRFSPDLTVYYHGGCVDGIAGAWVFWLELPEPLKDALAAQGGICRRADAAAAAEAPRPEGSPDTKRPAWNLDIPIFMGITHGQDLPEETWKGRHVVFVDIAHKAAVLARIADEALSLTILDHHRSSAADVEAVRGRPNVTVVHDESRSGAQLAWDWYEETYAGTPAGDPRNRPDLINYIGDRDLWRWELPRSKEVNNALFIRYAARSFYALSEETSSFDARALAVEGEHYGRYEKMLVDRALYTSVRCVVAVEEDAAASVRPEYKARLVMSQTLTSEIGNSGMDDDCDFVMVVQTSLKTDEYWVSMRTTRSDVDLSKIAPRVKGATKGGGHPKAAGFTLPGTTHLRTRFPAAAPPTAAGTSAP